MDMDTIGHSLNKTIKMAKDCRDNGCGGCQAATLCCLMIFFMFIINN